MEGTRSQDSNVDSFLSGQPGKNSDARKKQGIGPGEHSSGEGGT